MVTFESPFGLIMSTRESVCLLNGTLSVTSAHLSSVGCSVKDLGAATGAAIITGAAVGAAVGADITIEAVGADMAGAAMTGAAMTGAADIDTVTDGAAENILYPAPPRGVFVGEAPKSYMPIGVGGMVPPEAKFIGFGTAVFLSLT